MDNGVTRHFTVTAFVSTRQATLLHWHRKVGLWLPPGGHIEANEDPVEAVLREVQEETGLHVELVSQAPRFTFLVPAQLPPPVTILLEDINATPSTPAHQHIDLIYFAELAGAARVAEVPGLPRVAPAGWVWATGDELSAGALRRTPSLPTPAGPPTPPTQDSEPDLTLAGDVCQLGLAAIAGAGHAANS